MSEESSGDGSSRRGFFKAATLALGAAIGAVLAVPLVKYLFYPVGKKTVSAPDAPVDVLEADKLVAGGEPVLVSIVASNVRDGWNVADNKPVGAAYLQKSEAGEISAFSSACPHLGCAIKWSGEADAFLCPCHKSRFEKNGDKASGPSKRGLDPLPVVVEDGRVKVAFVRYRADVSEREEV